MVVVAGGVVGLAYEGGRDGNKVSSLGNTMLISKGN